MFTNTDAKFVIAHGILQKSETTCNRCKKVSEYNLFYFLNHFYVCMSCAIELNPANRMMVYRDEDGMNHRIFVDAGGEIFFDD